MKPTRLHYFYANNWPARLWLLAWPLAGAGLMALALGPPTERGWWLLVGLGAVLAWFLGGLVGVFVLGPLYFHRSALNGAPFAAGEEVEILVGRNRGRVVRVAGAEDFRGYVRIEDGRYFSPLALLRSGDAAPAPTGRAPEPAPKDGPGATPAPQ